MFWMFFALFLAACLAAAATGALFPPGAWYRALTKPRWTPPDLAFPVVWSLLYLGIAIAGARLAMTPQPGIALGLWSVQIALNTLWTPVFFGARRMRAGLVVILLLWTTIAVSVPVFSAVDPVAALLFAPYLAWVTVAACLNAALIRLNPQAATPNG